MNIQTLIYVTIKKYLPAYFFLGLLINISYFVYPAFMLQVYNTALVSYSVENLLLLVLISAPLVFFGAYFESLRSKLLTFLGLKVKHELMLKEPILQSVIKESYLSKVDAIFKYFKSGLVNSIHDSIWIPVFIFGVYLLHSSLALSITILVILKIVADFTLVREAEKNFSEYEKLNTIFTIARGRFKNHVSFLRVNALESKIDNELNENYNAISKFAITEADKKSMQSFLTNCIKNVGQVGILAQGAYLVILGEVSPANMIVGTILFGRIMSVSANFAQSIINLNSIKRNFFREPFTTSFAAISQREKLNETGD
ncbi:MAG: hypothetical protein SVW51_13265, partial [Pseudomonadota bacterium]|nr:hypothetical protein [Pseudomonadota bacterium]